MKNHIGGAMTKRSEELTADQRNEERRRSEIAGMRYQPNWEQVYMCLIMFAEHVGYSVREEPLIWYDGLAVGSRIGIRKSLDTAEERARNLAHELGHLYLLKGQARDLIRNPDQEEERRADSCPENAEMNHLGVAVEQRNQLWRNQKRNRADYLNGCHRAE